MVEIKDRAKLLGSLKHRVFSYKNRDRRRYGIEENGLTVDICMELIEKSDGICTSCNCEMLFENVTRHCVYQFTIDAIDPPKGHTKDNIRLLCYECNSRSGLVMGTGGPSGKLGFKKEWPCIGGCHLINGFTREQMENGEHLSQFDEESNITISSLRFMSARERREWDNQTQESEEDIHDTVQKAWVDSIPIYADKKLGTVEWEKICCLRNKLRKTVDEKEILSIREEIRILEEKLVRS